MSGKLGDILVSHGVIDQEKLIAALSDQFAFGGKLGRTLKTLIIRLESTVNAQSRAFRALVNLLQDKGVVRRGELGQRASRK
jgi:hypothetical protein